MTTTRTPSPDFPVYSLVRRSSSSWNAVTGKPVILEEVDLAYGTRPGGPSGLHNCLVQLDARNLLLGEAERDRFELLRDGEPISAAEVAAEDVQPDAVADYLVAVFGLAGEEAERLVR